MRPSKSSAHEGSVEISAVEKQVARKISTLRKENGLTLKSLGKLTGLSESYLSRVENFKTVISLSSLARLAEAFVLPVSIFFETSEGTVHFVHQKAGEGKVVRLRGRNGVNVKLLASQMKERMMEPFLIDVNSGRPDMPMQSHPGQEFIHVLQGKCLFQYGREHVDLEEGDSLYFDSMVNHKIEPIEGEYCQCVAVVTAKDFSFHGDIARLLNE